MVRQENHIVVVVDVVYVNNTFDMALRHVYKQRIAFSFSPSLSLSLAAHLSGHWSTRFVRNDDEGDFLLSLPLSLVRSFDCPLEDDGMSLCSSLSLLMSWTNCFFEQVHLLLLVFILRKLSRAFRSSESAGKRLSIVASPPARSMSAPLTVRVRHWASCWWLDVPTSLLGYFFSHGAFSTSDRA